MNNTIIFLIVTHKLKWPMGLPTIFTSGKRGATYPFTYNTGADDGWNQACKGHPVPMEEAKNHQHCSQEKKCGGSWHPNFCNYLLRLRLVDHHNILQESTKVPHNRRVVSNGKTTTHKSFYKQNVQDNY